MGKWKASGALGSYSGTITPSGHPAFVVADRVSEEDAALIVNAPELFEELKRCVELLGKTVPESAQEVLSKTLGEGVWG